MTLDHGLLSDGDVPRPRATDLDALRATRLTASVLSEVRTELWMGGAHTDLGDPMRPEHLTAAWVVDCAGELPRAITSRAARHLPRVFTDIEAVPSNLGRIDDLVGELSVVFRGAEGPDRVYVLCQQGMNRSGLVAALVLRALGATSDEAVAVVRNARPGALNNATFVELVRRPVVRGG